MELGSGEILLILVVALLVYGGRLPDVARAVGHSFGELKRGLTETKDAVASQLDAGNLDDSEAPRRDILRIHREHEDLAKEDISSAAVEPSPPRDPPPDAPKGPSSA